MKLLLLCVLALVLPLDLFAKFERVDELSPTEFPDIKVIHIGEKYGVEDWPKVFEVVVPISLVFGHGAEAVESLCLEIVENDRVACSVPIEMTRKGDDLYCRIQLSKNNLEGSQIRIGTNNPLYKYLLFLSDFIR